MAAGQNSARLRSVAAAPWRSPVVPPGATQATSSATPASACTAAWYGAELRVSSHRQLMAAGGRAVALARRPHARRARWARRFPGPEVRPTAQRAAAPPGQPVGRAATRTSVRRPAARLPWCSHGELRAIVSPLGFTSSAGRPAICTPTPGSIGPVPARARAARCSARRRPGPAAPGPSSVPRGRRAIPSSTASLGDTPAPRSIRSLNSLPPRSSRAAENSARAGREAGPRRGSPRVPARSPTCAGASGRAWPESRRRRRRRV